MQQLDNTTPNQEGENQTSPSILNYYLNPLPGLENRTFKFVSGSNPEIKDEYYWDLIEGFLTNFESEPE